MKRFGFLLTSICMGLGSYCFGDGLDFLNDKHPILGYEDQEFYSECTSEEDTTLRQRECLSMCPLSEYLGPRASQIKR